jgi:hypothetical protein
MSPALVSPPPAAVAGVLGALGGLVVLKTVMLAALFTGTPPFPPPFLAPLIGASIALAVLAAALVAARSRLFLAPTLAFAASALLSYGPHKLVPWSSPLFSAQDPAVYPAVAVGSLLVGVLLVASLHLWRGLGCGAGKAQV